MYLDTLSNLRIIVEMDSDKKEVDKLLFSNQAEQLVYIKNMNKGGKNYDGNGSRS